MGEEGALYYLTDSPQGMGGADGIRGTPFVLGGGVRRRRSRLTCRVGGCGVWRHQSGQAGGREERCGGRRTRAEK